VVNGDHREGIYKKIKEIYKGWGNLRIIKSELKFLPANLSLGLHNCTGEYVARLDSDDIAYPGRCEAQVKYLELNRNIGVVGSWMDAINEDRIPYRIIKVPERSEEIKKKIFFGNPIKHPTVMFRRKIVLDAGGYMGPLLCEDYELWVRLMFKQKTEFGNINSPLIKYSMVNRGGRRNKVLYANLIAIQLSAYLQYGNIKWILGMAINFVKLLYVKCIKK
jgi:glycosyltransferase involved in cell wall biosynthesis